MNSQITFLTPAAFKLKIHSKKLHSGKCQIKFYAQMAERKNLYGYVLVDAKSTLKEVVHTINGRLIKIKNKDHYHHTHLYSLIKKKQDNSGFIIFEA